MALSPSVSSCFPALAYSGVRIHTRSNRVGHTPALQNSQGSGSPRDSQGHAVTCWPGDCSLLLCGFLCLYLSPRKGSRNTKCTRHTDTFQGQSIQRCNSQSRERAQGKEICPCGKNAETAYSLPVTPGTHDPQTSISKRMEMYSQHWGPEVHSQDVDWALPPLKAPGKNLFLFWLW